MTDCATAQSATFCPSMYWPRWIVGRPRSVVRQTVCAATMDALRIARMGVGIRAGKAMVSRFVVWIWVWVGDHLRVPWTWVHEYAYGRAGAVAVVVVAQAVEVWVDYPHYTVRTINWPEVLAHLVRQRRRHSTSFPVSHVGLRLPQGRVHCC